MLKKALLISLLLPLLALVVLAVLILQSRPLVQTSPAQQIEQADSLTPLVGQLHRAYIWSHRGAFITLNDEQANALMGSAQRALPDLKGRVNIAPTAAIVALSYTLIPNQWYLNLSLEIAPGPGIPLIQARLGDLNLPGDWLLNALVWAIDGYLGEDIAITALNSVRATHMQASTLQVEMAPLAPLLAQLETLGGGTLDRRNQALTLRVIHYLDVLSALPSGVAQQTMAARLRGLFSEVVTRSNDHTAVQENRAAMLAFSLFDGGRRFRHFIGGIRLAHIRPSGAGALTLAGRRDLYLHFSFSAAIQLLSVQGISLAAGELKELIDRGQGGSGYSFADLAADMAGNALAEALVEPSSARQAQQLLATLAADEAIFPAIHDLPEGLNKDSFYRQFGEVDSPAYQQMLVLINQRIEQLPFYRQLHQATTNDASMWW